jgi:hypothetical protein
MKLRHCGSRQLGTEVLGGEGLGRLGDMTAKGFFSPCVVGQSALQRSWPVGKAV